MAQQQLRHHFRRNPDHYIDRQCHLDPYPESPGLRNSIFFRTHP